MSLLSMSLVLALVAMVGIRCALTEERLPGKGSPAKYIFVEDHVMKWKKRNDSPKDIVIEDFAMKRKKRSEKPGQGSGSGGRR